MRKEVPIILTSSICLILGILIGYALESLSGTGLSSAYQLNDTAQEPPETREKQRSPNLAAQNKETRDFQPIDAPDVSESHEESDASIGTEIAESLEDSPESSSADTGWVTFSVKTPDGEPIEGMSLTLAWNYRPSEWNATGVDPTDRSISRQDAVREAIRRLDMQRDSARTTTTDSEGKASISGFRSGRSYRLEFEDERYEVRSINSTPFDWAGFSTLRNQQPYQNIEIETTINIVAEPTTKTYVSISATSPLYPDEPLSILELWQDGKRVRSISAARDNRYSIDKGEYLLRIMSHRSRWEVVDENFVVNGDGKDGPFVYEGAEPQGLTVELLPDAKGNVINELEIEVLHADGKPLHSSGYSSGRSSAHYTPSSRTTSSLLLIPRFQAGIMLLDGVDLKVRTMLGKTELNAETLRFHGPSQRLSMPGDVGGKGRCYPLSIRNERGDPIRLSSFTLQASHEDSRWRTLCYCELVTFSPVNTERTQLMKDRPLFYFVPDEAQVPDDAVALRIETSADSGKFVHTFNGLLPEAIDVQMKPRFSFTLVVDKVGPYHQDNLSFRLEGDSYTFDVGSRSRASLDTPLLASNVPQGEYVLVGTFKTFYNDTLERVDVTFLNQRVEIGSKDLKLHVNAPDLAQITVREPQNCSSWNLRVVPTPQLKDQYPHCLNLDRSQYGKSGNNNKLILLPYGTYSADISYLTEAAPGVPGSGGHKSLTKVIPVAGDMVIDLE